jgi:hypothetical protein
MSTPDLTVGTVAKGKGVHREGESEGSPKAKDWPWRTGISYLGVMKWASPHIKTKPYTVLGFMA